jgi:hypothetical protein
MIVLLPFALLKVICPILVVCVSGDAIISRGVSPANTGRLVAALVLRVRLFESIENSSLTVVEPIGVTPKTSFDP